MNENPNFWEKNFIEKQEMWGFEPSNSAVLTKDFFIEKSVKNILIPGIGYGRNAQIFKDNGIEVTGIEISKTAIEMARKHYGPGMPIFHGSVTDMPFDNCQYDGIFCYALIHLLDSTERHKLIRDCYNQLSKDGYMVFTAISKEAHTYGKGKFVSKDRIKLIVRIILILSISASLVASVTSMIRGRVSVEFYLSIYAILYGIFPASLVLIALAINNKINKKPIWPFIKIEVILIMITLLTIFLPSVFIK